MINVHRRVIAASAEEIRPWIESAWSATERDIFPRDAIRSWRKNPPGIEPLALIPGVTRVGHGMFSFRVEAWDGTFWRARIESDQYRGWQGFDLRPIGDACELTHTVECDLQGAGRVFWPAFIGPIHDWCIEAIFDRLECALRTGTVPATTERPMPLRTAMGLKALRAAIRAGALRLETARRPAPNVVRA
ncbi:MAG: hypothetical protein ABI551_07750 [Polyangiaceae bacterium]